MTPIPGASRDFAVNYWPECHGVYSELQEIKIAHGNWRKQASALTVPRSKSC
jgi:hypothetical protein